MIHVIITEDLCSLQGLHHILFILPLQFIILKKLSWSSDDIFKFYVCSGDDSQDKKTDFQADSIWKMQKRQNQYLCAANLQRKYQLKFTCALLVTCTDL